MQKLKVNELKEHPKNTYFFDDMIGEKWNEFLESVKTSGVIEPVICTQDKIIVSGHQRIRACKELGIKDVNCEIRIYDNEDKIIRQRGDIGGSSVKIGRRIKELERLYGIKHGNNQHQDSDIVGIINTQEDLAQQLGISVDSLSNYKKLTTLIPELQDMVDEEISFSVASRILSKLTQEEQEKLLEDLGQDKLSKMTIKQTQEYIDKTKKLEQENKLQEKELNEKINKLSHLENELLKLKQELEDRPVVEKEVSPYDYDANKKMLEDYRTDYKNLQNQYQNKVTEINQIKKELESMQQNTPEEQFNKKIKDSTIFFCARISEFLEKVGGYVWLVDHINELPELEKKSYYSAINAISAWSENLKSNINN